jgi:hypothetical protein
MIIHIVDNARWVFIFCLAYAKYVFNLTNNITLTQDDFSVLYYIHLHKLILVFFFNSMLYTSFFKDGNLIIIISIYFFKHFTVTYYRCKYPLIHYKDTNIDLKIISLLILAGCCSKSNNVI